MANKPLLLVDVDGVLNCFGGFWSEEHDVAEWEHFFDADDGAGNSYPFRVPQGTSARLAKLSEAFEPVWCTTWEDQAHPNLGEHLGLGDPWPVIHFANTLAARTWKLPSVQRFVEDKPLAWIDDDLGSDAEAWAHSRSTEDEIPTLLVRTRCSVGLTDEHVEQLLAFAQNL